MAWTCLWHFGIRPVVGAVLFAALVSLSWGDQRVVCHNHSLPEPLQMRPVPGAVKNLDFLFCRVMMKVRRFGLIMIYDDYKLEWCSQDIRKLTQPAPGSVVLAQLAPSLLDDECEAGMNAAISRMLFDQSWTSRNDLVEHDRSTFPIIYQDKAPIKRVVLEAAASPIRCRLFLRAFLPQELVSHFGWNGTTCDWLCTAWRSIPIVKAIWLSYGWFKRKPSGCELDTSRHAQLHLKLCLGWSKQRQWRNECVLWSATGDLISAFLWLLDSCRELLGAKSMVPRNLHRLHAHVHASCSCKSRQLWEDCARQAWEVCRCQQFKETHEADV